MPKHFEILCAVFRQENPALARQSAHVRAVQTGKFDKGRSPQRHFSL